MSKYYIKDGYKENLKNLYYNDVPIDNVTWQPDVYRYAIEYAKKQGIKNIIDIGSGNGEKLLNHKDTFNITFIDYGPNLKVIEEKFQNSLGKHTYIEQNFEDNFPTLPNALIKNSVVICSDVIEHIRDMNNLSRALVVYSNNARLLIISTPERERTYGYDQNGPPGNHCHVREWKLEELRNYLSSLGMKHLIGLTRSNDRSNQRSTQFVLSGMDFVIKKDRFYDKIAKQVTQNKIISKNELLNIFKALKIKAPKFDEKFIGLYNPYPENYTFIHFINAIRRGSTYGVNRFKFISTELQNKSMNLANIDSSIMQFIGFDEGDYPVNFTFIYDGDLYSEASEDLLPTLSAQHIAINYLPENILGFNLIEMKSEIIAQLPNYSNIKRDVEIHKIDQIELRSHLGVKRSAKLFAGNIKRRINKM